MPDTTVPPTDRPPRTRPDPDRCPTCDKAISDTDPDGCETATGQRYCLAHLPREADPELYDTYQRFVQAEAGR